MIWPLADAKNRFREVMEDRAYQGWLDSGQAALRQSARYLRQFLPGKRRA